MSLTTDDLEQYRAKRVDADGVGGTLLKKELGSLKAAIDWAVRTGMLGKSPIKEWPKIRVQRLKRFEWKTDIDAMVAGHTFDTDEARKSFLDEMSMRMVLTADDMRQLVVLANERASDLALPLMIVCATGMRRKELVLLRKQDFDPRRGTLIVTSRKQSRSEEVTTRTVVLPQDVGDALSAHHRSLPASERMLFPVFSAVDKSYRNRWVEYENCREMLHWDSNRNALHELNHRIIHCMTPVSE